MKRLLQIGVLIFMAVSLTIPDAFAFTEFFWNPNPEPDLAKYTIYCNGNVVKDAGIPATGTDGKVSYPMSGIVAEGSNTCQLAASDTSGNEGNKTAPINFLQDTHGPDATGFGVR